VDAEQSSRSALAQARDQMESAGANIIGGVYNNFDPSASATYPYYYYNYYNQYYGTEASAANGTRATRRLFGRRNGARDRATSDARGRVSASGRTRPRDGDGG
jgi:hypothetical protein